MGAILPAIQMAENPENEAFLFIADMHSLTQIKDPKELHANTIATAIAWLACGLDPNKTFFYRQSDVPETTELTWYLMCHFPFQRLNLAHSFKDKADRLQDVNAGLFTYPMLMAADILLYDAELVPVGKDQLQHLEFTRDVAARFNHKMGEIFVLPKDLIQQDTMLIPGIDGEKMSKSKGNLVFVSQLLKDGVDPMAIRIALMSHHYRMDHMWQEDDLSAAQELLDDLRIALSRMEVAPTDQVITAIISALSQDIDTPTALKALKIWIAATNKGETGGHPGELSRAIDALLGIAI
jgi:tryptophanyl-tRNA synthetase